MPEENPLHALAGLKIGVLGCGNMGGALVAALCRSGSVPPAAVHVYDRLSDAAEHLADALGCTPAGSADALVEAADIVILAVKPRDIIGLLATLRWPDAPRLFISVAAGVRLDALQELIPSRYRVVRAMPNTPARVGSGITALLRTSDAEAFARAAAIFATCGEVIALRDEAHFDPVTALSGSGPAYAMIAAEAMADAGVKMGLTRDVAQALALHTLRGAADLAIQTNAHPAAIKDAVASPGGTTIYGIAALERGGFRAALMDAVEAATERAWQLGRKV